MSKKIIIIMLAMFLGKKVVSAEELVTGLYNYESEKINIEINLLNEKEMEIRSGDGYSVIETTKGTYSIVDNKLTFTRVYTEISNEEGSSWILCDAANGECGDIEFKTEEFIILDSNTLETDVYTKRAGRTEEIVTLKNPTTKVDSIDEKIENNINIGNEINEKQTEIKEQNPQKKDYIIKIILGGILIIALIMKLIINKR